MVGNNIIGTGDHLYLVDGSGYIFRAYHALPPLTRRSDGAPIGAVAGFCNMLVKLMRDMDEVIRPTHLAVMFDTARSDLLRRKIYPDYKAHRPPPPDDLIPQFPLVRDAVRAFGIPAIEADMYEADDLIASYACDAARAGANVTIVSSDKDMMQLVNEMINMVDTMRDRWIDHDAVIEKFGVPPAQVVDVQALAGDASDNVPGVPGIGIKIAAELIRQFHSLEALLEQAHEITQNKRRENLIEFAQQARMSRELVYLRQDAPRNVSYEDMRITPPEPEKLIGFMKAMEFNSLTQRLAEYYAWDINAYAADQNLAARPGNATTQTVQSPIPAMPPINTAEYACITDIKTLKNWTARAQAQGILAIDTETNGLDTMQCRLVGISLSLEPGVAGYIPLAHQTDKDENANQQASLALAPSAPTRKIQDTIQDEAPIQQLTLDDVQTVLAPILEDIAVLKIFQNAKFDIAVLMRHGFKNINAIDDTMLMSYVVNAGRGGGHGMNALSIRYLEHKPRAITDLIGSGKKQISFDKVPIPDAVAYAAEDADVTLRLWHHLRAEMVTQSVVHVYQTLERPMIPIIAEMERNGIQIDRAQLAQLSETFARAMNMLETEIYDAANGTFNIASPKQLGDILFVQMSVQGGKRTKTGAWVTDAQMLENISTENTHSQAAILAKKVLQWRGYAKLKSTYTDALPNFINPESGRVHTSYALAATTTGRLASSEPNLQNIPIRDEDGRQIRAAFVAAPGHLLLSADYGQIELRLLAHIADITVLKSVLAEGGDIHAMTAAEVFNIPPSEMTAEIRRRAKAINFGIIYGISAFGLANQLGVSRQEADAYIKAYFEKFPGIRDYIETTRQKARAEGAVTTIFGRKIHTPEIDSKNPARRAFAERAAINAPLQGSAADIIRRAMINIPQELKNTKSKARMLLQVHDELIFELPKTETETLTTTVKKIMINAPLPAIQLSVPLVVDAYTAHNWNDAHP